MPFDALGCTRATIKTLNVICFELIDLIDDLINFIYFIVDFIID